MKIREVLLSKNDWRWLWVEKSICKGTERWEAEATGVRSRAATVNTDKQACWKTRWTHGDRRAQRTKRQLRAAEAGGDLNTRTKVLPGGSGETRNAGMYSQSTRPTGRQVRAQRPRKDNVEMDAEKSLSGRGDEKCGQRWGFKWVAAASKNNREETPQRREGSQEGRATWGKNAEVFFKVEEGFYNNHPECCSVCMFVVFHSPPQSKLRAGKDIALQLMPFRLWARWVCALLSWGTLPIPAGGSTWGDGLHIEATALRETVSRGV